MISDHITYIHIYIYIYMYYNIIYITLYNNSSASSPPLLSLFALFALFVLSSPFSLSCFSSPPVSRPKAGVPTDLV